MEKKQVSFISLLAGSLLYFKEVDSLDLLLVAEDLNAKGFDVDCSLKHNLSGYIVQEKKKIKIRRDVPLRTVTSRFSSIEGPEIESYFDRLNLSNFCLRKMSKIECITRERLREYFSEYELNEVGHLLQSGHAVVEWNTIIPGQKFEQIRITSKGKIKLFMDKYPDEIREFKIKLNSLNYNTIFLEEYLKEADLKLPVFKVLDPIPYGFFCNRQNHQLLNEVKRAI